MDNNNTAQVPQNSIPPQQPSTPQPVAPTPPVPPPQIEEGNKMAIWLIGGLIVVIAVVGLIYWYLGRGASKQADQPVKTPPPVSQEPNLEEDLNAIEVGDVESELSDVDKDLESL